MKTVLAVLTTLALQLSLNTVFSADIQHDGRTVPDGYEMATNGGYYKFHSNVNATTWHVARQTCLNEQADLAIINSELELYIVWSILEENSATEAFIGFTDMVTYGTYYTSDGQLLTDVFVSWNSGEPNNSGGNEHCGQLKLIDNVAGFNDIGCDYKDSFVCELH